MPFKLEFTDEAISKLKEVFDIDKFGQAAINMCTTRNWKRIEAKEVSDDKTTFELVGMRSDGVLITEYVKVGMNFGGTVKEIVEQILNFDSMRNCQCNFNIICERHKLK